MRPVEWVSWKLRERYAALPELTDRQVENVLRPHTSGVVECATKDAPATPETSRGSTTTDRRP